MLNPPELIKNHQKNGGKPNATIARGHDDTGWSGNQAIGKGSIPTPTIQMQCNVNPGLINHGLLIRGYSSNSHFIWYLNDTPPIKKP